MERDVLRPNEVEVLLFDLGGVVIEIDFGRCFSSWARSAGGDVEGIARRVGQDAAYRAHETGELDFLGYCAHLRATLDLDLSDEELLAGWNNIYTGEIAGMPALLREAALRFPTYAFTNSNPTHQAVWSERFATLGETFSAVFVSSTIGLRKPDRAAFEHVARAIGVPASAILFFDDSPENVDGAIAAGLQAVPVTSIDSVRAALALLS